MREGKTMEETITITGAFSYTGKYFTRLLLDRGYPVRKLTNHPRRENPFGNSLGDQSCKEKPLPLGRDLFCGDYPALEAPGLVSRPLRDELRNFTLCR
jgi:hypothetical protein